MTCPALGPAGSCPGGAELLFGVLHHPSTSYAGGAPWSSANPVESPKHTHGVRPVDPWADSRPGRPASDSPPQRIRPGRWLSGGLLAAARPGGALLSLIVRAETVATVGPLHRAGGVVEGELRDQVAGA